MTMKIRILAIFGETYDLDLTEHKKALESLPGVEIVYLINKTLQEITDQLWDEIWSVVFFAGHSKTNFDDDKSTGLIQINEQEKIIINDLEEALRRATEKGLQLAIFNSCDGTGLARKALKFGVPRIIVFREQVPNKVAATFLRYFLNIFQKKELPLALREARQRLQGLQNKFPCATWLPVLFKNSITPTLTWEMLGLEIPDILPKQKGLIGELINIISQIFSDIKVFCAKHKKAVLILLFLMAMIGAFMINPLRIHWPWENVKSNNTQTQTQTPELIGTFCTPKDKSIENLLSCGGKTLFSDQTQNQDKTNGMASFNDGKYKEAKESFENAFEKKKNPETLIFRNNAEILANKTNKDNIFPMAVALNLPNQENPAYKTNMLTLQGIAYFQDKYNHQNNEQKLFLLLANDNNKYVDYPDNNCDLPPNKNDSDPDEKLDRKNRCYAIDMAQKIVERKPYAVIGHYSSRITFYTLLKVYQKANIPLMAFSATATHYTSNKGTKKEEIISLEKQPYFFRVVSTTRDSAKKLANYLNNLNSIKNVVSVKSDKLFSGSFDQEFKSAWKVEEDKTIENITLGNKEQTIEDIENILKNKNAKDTAIVLCPDAFTNKDDHPERKKTESIIQKANQYQLIIGGCNVVAVYPKAVKSKNIIVAVPWSPSSQNQSNNTNILNDLNQKWKDNNFEQTNHEASMRRALGYDAALVLGESFEKKSFKNGSQLQQYLVNDKPRFQGITGEISFNGSDRAQDTSVLITPNCSSEKCEEWKLAE